jgi:hypothetical protein
LRLLNKRSCLPWTATPSVALLTSIPIPLTGFRIPPACPVLSVRAPTQPTVRAQDLHPHGRPHRALGTKDAGSAKDNIPAMRRCTSSLRAGAMILVRSRCAANGADSKACLARAAWIFWQGRKVLTM